MPESTADPALSDAARRRVLTLAATALGALPEAEVPVSLQRVRKFAPGRRSSAGALPLASALRRDAAFRSRVAKALRESEPDLAAALDGGSPAAAADPVDVAVVAFVLRPHGWYEMVERATALERSRHRAAAAGEVSAEVERLRAELDQARADVLRARHEAARSHQVLEGDLLSARQELRRHRADADRARAQAREALVNAERVKAAAAAGVEAADERARRAERDVASAQEALQAMRRAEREGRSLAGSRARLLLDTVVDAAIGLRLELALPAVDVLPADVVSAGGLDSSAAPAGARAQDDAAVLGQLIRLPRAHLVVDGYNVTISAYGALPLVDQRHRLVGGLAGVAARTHVEITCVFDGAALDARVAAPSVRGVRVLFSAPGETADELIRRLVGAEPQGRVVVVVSSDREVADGVRASGAHPVSSVALAALLDRG